MRRHIFIITLVGALALLVSTALAQDPAAPAPEQAVGDDQETATPEGAPDFNVYVETLDSPVYLLYVEGVAADDYEAKLMEAVTTGTEYGLMTDDTIVASVYPSVMSDGYDESSVVYFGLGMEELPDAEVGLEVFEMPQGEYLVVEHIGPFENIGDTWTAALEWAAGHGIEFLEEGVCGEVYMSDPDNTPAEELQSAIFLPLVPGQAHELGHPGYVGSGPGEDAKHEQHASDDDGNGDDEHSVDDHQEEHGH